MTHYKFVDITPEAEADIVAGWREFLAPRLGSLATQEVIDAIIAENSDPTNVDKKYTIPGNYSFGDDLAVFYAVYADLVGRTEALGIVAHEKEHADAYARHGVRSIYGLVLYHRADGAGLGVRPYCEPQFPPEMSTECRRKIFAEATAAVSEASDFDLRAIAIDKALG